MLRHPAVFDFLLLRNGTPVVLPGLGKLTHLILFVAASDAKFCELGLVPAAGAEFKRKQSIYQGKSPFPLVESTPERS